MDANRWKSSVNLGESSSNCRNHSSASFVDDRERPFKKARYVWQLKGKYHLKANCVSIRNRNLHRNNKRLHSDTDSDTENNSRMSNSSKFNHSNLINALLIRSNALLDDNESFDDSHVTNIDKTLSDDIPITLVAPNHRMHEEYLQKWHTRQLAKSYVDNTINSLMELWKIAPFDASDLIENCENDGQVEDEGILMAIQSHGLQTSFQRHDISSHRTNFHSLRFMNVNNADASLDDHFLTAAVSAAIQKNGLSSYNYG